MPPEPKNNFPAFALATGLLCATAAWAAASLDEARALHRQGDLEAAAAAYRAALDGGLDEASAAVANNNLCLVLDTLGEHVPAEAACRAALEVRRRLDDRPRLARTLNNLGLVQQHLGHFASAEERFTEALAINRELGEAFGEAINLANLGALSTQSGRFQDALERHEAVTALARAHEAEWWAADQLRIAELNRAVVLERLGAYREALDVYRALLAAEAGLDPGRRASVLVNAGVVYRNLGDPRRAIEHFGTAASIYRETGDLSGLAHVELNVGIARHLNLSDPAGAEESYRRALALVERSGERTVEIECLASLGRLLVETGRGGEARRMLERGLSLARESGSPEATWGLLAGLGELARLEGDLEESWRRFEASIRLIEAGRTGVARAEHRASFFDDKRAIYAGALRTLAELNRKEGGGRAGEALRVAQQAKARDLLDALELRRVARSSRAPVAAPLDAPDLLGRLGDDALIEYFVGSEDLFAWWSADGSLRMKSLGRAGPILDLVRGVHASLANGLEPDRASVEELSARLLAPLEPFPSSARRYWIAPDRRLGYLPFEILPVPDGSVRLIERARVAYLPSAWALPDRSSRESEGRPELAFAGFGGIRAADATYPAWVMRLGLEPLEEARAEIEDVGRRLGGRRALFTGGGATEEAFRMHAGKPLGVLHFATHAALSAGRAGRAAILLTPAGEDDGLLSASEVVDAGVSASLVVLASCATALGDEEDGRALATLTGSFLATGSEAVLATLWPVGDQPTAVFMEQFYFQLARGLPPDEALRRTKLRFLARDDWENAALWSGYVLVGSARAVAPDAHAGRWLVVLALAATLSGVGVVLVRRRRTAKARTRVF